MIELSIKNLNFYYDKIQILEDISVNIDKKEFCIITGPNGSGKTTFLKSILNIVPIKKNQIFINEKDIKKMSNIEISKKISYVGQNFYENNEFEFSVYEIVQMGRYPYKDNFFDLSINDRKIIEKYMKFTNSWELRDRNFNELSGGEKQRVIITKALVQDTDIIILDEPLASLDIYYRVEFMELLEFLNKKCNKTIIMVLHDINMILKYAERVIFMENGKIVFDGNKDKIINENIFEKIYKIKFEKIKNENDRYIFPKKNQFIFEMED